MAIYKRGGVYWFSFIFSERRIQKSTKQGNRKAAIDIESAFRTALAKGEVGITSPKREKRTVGELLDALKANYETNGKLSAQNKSLLTRAKEDFDSKMATELTAEDVAKYIERMYNIRGRTASNILPETVARLAEIKNVVGIKEASASMDQSSDIIKLCERMTILSGDDALTLPIVALGGKGVISTCGNVVPREMHDLAAAAIAGDFAKARNPLSAAAPDTRAVRRDQPDSNQAGARLHGQMRQRVADAAGADDGGSRRQVAHRDERTPPRLIAHQPWLSRTTSSTGSISTLSGTALTTRFSRFIPRWSR